MSPVQPLAITQTDIAEAAQRIAGHAVRTPILRHEALDAALGGNLWIKPECLQRTGSFKFRGAFNAISALQATDPGCPVIAYSSGNHAQGVAAAAAHYGLQATIIMPADAPAIKQANTRRLGATIVHYERSVRENREEVAQTIIGRTGACLIPPYDHPQVMAGQGTVGQEIADDLTAICAQPDAVLMPAGGGGLSAGIATAIGSAFPDCRIVVCEPDRYDDVGRSLAQGKRLRISDTPPTLCDAIMTPTPGALTFPVLQAYHATGATVRDDEVLHAMAVAYFYLKLVVEPGGAAALAALLSGKVDIKGKTAVAILSGGNVDGDVFVRALDLARHGPQGLCPAAVPLSRPIQQPGAA